MGAESSSFCHFSLTLDIFVSRDLSKVLYFTRIFYTCLFGSKANSYAEFGQSGIKLKLNRSSITSNFHFSDCLSSNYVLQNHHFPDKPISKNPENLIPVLKTYLKKYLQDDTWRSFQMALGATLYRVKWTSVWTKFSHLEDGGTMFIRNIRTNSIHRTV
jgi:hypothetical protein